MILYHGSQVENFTPIYGLGNDTHDYGRGFYTTADKELGKEWAVGQQANADGIRFIREAGADQAVLTIKSLEAFAKAADGKSTKIIIPSDIQGIAGLAAGLKEIAGNDGKAASE